MKYLENEKDFNELINKDKVLVDFYADWCGPCKMIGPILEEIANENSDLEVVKVNVDNFENIARSYGIMSIPTLIVFEKGKEVNKSIGFVDKDSILNLIK